MAELTRRLAALARSRLRLGPLRWKRRWVYGFSLDAPVPDVRPDLPVTFGLRLAPAADPTDAAPPGPPGSEIYVGATLDGREVYHMRVSTARASLLRLLPACRVPARAALIYDCHTAPASRGHRIYPAALTYLLARLRADGYQAAYIRVAPDNPRSARGIESAGFRRCATVHHVAILGFRLRPVGIAVTAGAAPPRADAAGARAETHR